MVRSAEDSRLDAVRQVARYWGENEAQRAAAFEADAEARAAGGWRVVSQITDWPIGKPGLDLVVTYEHDPEPGTATAPALAPHRGGRSRTADDSRRYRSEVRTRADWGIARFFLASGANEPAVARDLRRLLLYGSLLAAMTLRIVAVQTEQPGEPIPSQYPAMAVICVLEGLMGVGFAWYVLRWRRLPIVLRLLGIAFIALLVGTAVAGAHDYALGYPPG